MSSCSKPYSGIINLFTIIRDKMVPSLFEGKKPKKVLTDSCYCYFLFPHEEKEPHSILKKLLSALGKFEHSYTNVLSNLPRNEKMPTSQQPRFLFPNPTLSWCNCCFWREAHEATTSRHAAYQPSCRQVCVPRTPAPRYRDAKSLP